MCIQNLECTLLHPDVVEDYLAAEVINHRVANPYDKNSYPDATLADLG